MPFHLHLKRGSCAIATLHMTDSCSGMVCFSQSIIFMITTASRCKHLQKLLGTHYRQRTLGKFSQSSMNTKLPVCCPRDTHHTPDSFIFDPTQPSSWSRPSSTEGGIRSATCKPTDRDCKSSASQQQCTDMPTNLIESRCAFVAYLVRTRTSTAPMLFGRIQASTGVLDEMAKVLRCF